MSIFKSVCVKEADFKANPYVPAVYEIQELYVGQVLETGWKEYQVMSDVWETGYWAKVWDKTLNKTLHIDWVEPNGVVDATPEIWALHKQERINRAFEYMMHDAEQEALKIAKGDTVKVVKGRQSKGVEGKVVVLIQRQYGQGYYSSMQNKIAVALDDEMVEVPHANGKVYLNHKNVVWVWALNCEKLNTTPVDYAAIAADAKAKVEGEMASEEAWKNRNKVNA